MKREKTTLVFSDGTGDFESKSFNISSLYSQDFDIKLFKCQFLS